MSILLTSSFKEEPAEVYHEVKAVSSHAIISMHKSPKTYYDKYVLGKKEEPTPAMEFGTMFHCAILEPEKFKTMFHVEPKFDKRTTAGKEGYAAFKAGLPAGAKTVSAEDMDTLNGIVEAFNAHPLAPELIQGGVAEMSGYFTDINTGTPLKIRPDYIRADHTLIDLKTCRDASQNRFQSQVYDFGYYIQAAFYADVYSMIMGRELDSVPFVFIAIENTKPFNIGVYPLAKKAIQQGRDVYRSALYKYLECVNSGKWADLNESNAVEIDLPYWVYKRKEYQS